MATITNTIQEIPSDILQLVFSKLSIFNLPICRIVCKAWNKLVLDCASKFFPITSIICIDGVQPSNPNSIIIQQSLKPKIYVVDFSQMHLEGTNMNPSFTLEDTCLAVHFYNSCNGLLFVSKSDEDSSCVGILNPMTNEFFSVPTDWIENFYYYGFGFSTSTNYIVARVHFDMLKRCSFLEVFTFEGSDTWRRAHSLPSIAILKHGVYLNEALYWIGKHFDRNQFVAYRLDVESLKIEETFLSEDGSCKAMSFTILGGSLYATFISMDLPHKFQVWVMRSFEGKELWSREFVIDDIPRNWMVLPYGNPMYLEIIKVREDGEILCVVNHQNLFLYDSKMKMGRVRTSNQINQNRSVFLWACEIESFHFSSLQQILTEKDTEPTGTGQQVQSTQCDLDDGL